MAPDTWSAGCNQFSAQLWLTPQALSLVNPSHTDMGCDQPRHQQDQWVADFMTAGPAWHIEDHQLTLSTDDTNIELRQKAASGDTG